MRIDSYEFGRVVIEGVGFTGDVIIVGGAVHGDWWRKEGHVIRPEDLQSVIEARPSILVVGCGAYGMCKVAERTQQVLAAEAIEVEEYETAEAVRRFNELSAGGVNVAAALHLTC